MAGVVCNTRTFPHYRGLIQRFRTLFREARDNNFPYLEKAKAQQRTRENLTRNYSQKLKFKSSGMTTFVKKGLIPMEVILLEFTSHLYRTDGA